MKYSISSSVGTATGGVDNNLIAELLAVVLCLLQGDDSGIDLYEKLRLAKMLLRLLLSDGGCDDKLCLAISQLVCSMFHEHLLNDYRSVGGGGEGGEGGLQQQGQTVEEQQLIKTLWQMFVTVLVRANGKSYLEDLLLRMEAVVDGCCAGDDRMIERFIAFKCFMPLIAIQRRSNENSVLNVLWSIGLQRDLIAAAERIGAFQPLLDDFIGCGGVSVLVSLLLDKRPYRPIIHDCVAECLKQFFASATVVQIVLALDRIESPFFFDLIVNHESDNVRIEALSVLIYVRRALQQTVFAAEFDAELVRQGVTWAVTRFSEEVLNNPHIAQRAKVIVNMLSLFAP